VDQRPLPAAKQEVLDAREGKQFVLGVFGGHLLAVNGLTFQTV
jgi:hypothetical protein